MSKYTVEPYLTLLDPMTGRQPTVLVTDAGGRHRVYRVSPVDHKYLEYVSVAERGDVPSFSAEHPLMGPRVVEAFYHPDIYTALSARSAGGDMGAASLAGTSIAFTINGSTGPVNIIGVLPRNIATLATVTFVKGPAAPGEQIAFWAQQTTSGGGAAFEFDTQALSGSAPYQAGNAAYAVNGPSFSSGNNYNTWAVYPGDASNAAAKSNIVVLSIAAS